MWKDSVKYLGVHLDQKLSFKTHIQSSINKSNKSISALYCLLKNNSWASFKSKLTIYKSYIGPILTYACPVFFQLSKNTFQSAANYAEQMFAHGFKCTIPHEDSRIASRNENPNNQTLRRQTHRKSLSKVWISLKWADQITRKIYSRTTGVWLKHRMPRAIWAPLVTSIRNLFLSFLFFFCKFKVFFFSLSIHEISWS